MNEQQALRRMISPGMRRPRKRNGGVMQIWITRACDKSCFGCTQGSNLGGNPGMMSVEHFEEACKSLDGYFGTVGVFGGNPAMHPKFEDICEVMRRHVPFERRGLWCNNPLGKGKAMAETFNPSVSNLNVHLDHAAFREFKRDWPTSLPFGLDNDSRHSPVYVALHDVIPDEGERWRMISECDINQHWSAMLGVFRGELRGWFCEIAGAQSMLHQHEPDYPDTGVAVVPGWWQATMSDFAEQVRFHCHRCGVPLKGYGELAQAKAGTEQVSAEHLPIYKPKDRGRHVEVVTNREQVREKELPRFIDYLQNASK